MTKHGLKKVQNKQYEMWYDFESHDDCVYQDFFTT